MLIVPAFPGVFAEMEYSTVQTGLMNISARDKQPRTGNTQKRMGTLHQIQLLCNLCYLLEICHAVGSNCGQGASVGEGVG